MLSDPAPHKAKAEYLKVDFYAPTSAGESGGQTPSARAAAADAVPQRGGTHACK
jgi:hypothetical protein